LSRQGPGQCWAQSLVLALNHSQFDLLHGFVVLLLQIAIEGNVLAHRQSLSASVIGTFVASVRCLLGRTQSLVDNLWRRIFSQSDLLRFLGYAQRSGKFLGFNKRGGCIVALQAIPRSFSTTFFARVSPFQTLERICCCWPFTKANKQSGLGVMPEPSLH
jgi:hypothetical protein